MAALEALPALDEIIADIVSSGREGSGVHLPTDVFVACLAERIGVEPDPVSALRGVHAADLWLACACARGNAAALVRFESLYFSDVDAAAAAMRAPNALASDVKQAVSQKLFVGAGTAPPRIVDYAGRGPLRTWFRVVAARMIVSALRRNKRDVPWSDDALERTAALGDDPELMLLKRRFQAELKNAFEEAAAGLDARSRNLLRQHLLDGLSIDQLGALHRVHRATVARWVAQARESVWSATRKAITRRLQITPQELKALLSEIRSQLDLSLSRVLEEVTSSRC